LSLRNPLDLKSLKKEWLQALAEAKKLIPLLPTKDLGCLYLNDELTPVTPLPDDDSFNSRPRHWGTIRGTWPTML
jgi:hypothetical protein